MGHPRRHFSKGSQFFRLNQLFLSILQFWIRLFQGGIKAGILQCCPQTVGNGDEEIDLFIGKTILFHTPQVQSAYADILRNDGNGDRRLYTLSYEVRRAVGNDLIEAAGIVGLLGVIGNFHDGFTTGNLHSFVKARRDVFSVHIHQRKSILFRLINRDTTLFKRDNAFKLGVDLLEKLVDF